MSRWHGGSNPDFEALGGMPAFQYWDDFVSVFYSSLQEETLRSIGVWQRLVLGVSDPQSSVGNIADLWRSWLTSAGNMTMFPFEWMWRRRATVPSIVFAVDQLAESAGPQEAPTPIAAGGLVAQSTPLFSLMGQQPIAAAHVCAQLICDGNRLRVSLVDLGSGSPGSFPNPGTNILQPGVYLGMVFADDSYGVGMGVPLPPPPVGAARPLALLYVFVR